MDSSKQGFLNTHFSRFRFPSFLVCSNPLPAWTGHDFSFCFEDLVFGCAANLVTLFLIAFYSKQGSVTQKQKVKKAVQFLGLSRTLWVEILPAVGILVTVLQGLQLVLYGYDEMGHGRHTLLYLCLQGLAWVSSCWVLHYDYGVVMADYQYLRLWWLLRPILHVPYLYSSNKQSKVLWTPEMIEEILLLITSCSFGLSIFVIGSKVSSMIHTKNREFPLLTEPFLDSKLLEKNSGTSMLGISLWRALLFTWVTPLMDLGTTRQLEYDDLFILPENLDPKICSKWLLKSWDEEQQVSKQNSSLFRAIYLVYRKQYLSIGIVKILNDTCGFAGPLLLNAIVGSMENGSDKSLWVGYWCAISIGMVSMLRAFLGTQYTFLVAKLKLQLRASIIMLIYSKSLHMSLSDRSCFSNGEIQTLMSVDADRIVSMCGSLHELWSLPLQMVAALSLLYLQVKFSFVAGLAVIILLIPVNKVIASKIGVASKLMMKAKDERVRKMGEILTYIRTIKMYAWEDLISDRVMESRKEEVKYLGVRKYLDAWCVYFWATTPILFSFLTFGLYTLLGYKLDAAIVFTSLSLFNMLISPLNSFPWVINGLIEATVSLGRLRRFLLPPELKSESTEELDFGNRLMSTSILAKEESLEKHAVTLQNGSFTWDHGLQEGQVEHLKSINLMVPKGNVALLLGEVGSGKSSLLQAILGEMRYIQGQRAWQGQFGYVSQTPWILSGTVRENILFGKAFQKDRYESVLSACALDVDVERMTGKDLCIVGEQGFNLSGGQRSRVALARSIYQDCDILLFDDPLSSVDAHVAAWLLEHVFAGPLLAGKTVILSTYNVQALSVADLVILMEEGTVSWYGKVEDFNNHFQKHSGCTKKRLTDHYINSILKEESDSLVDTAAKYEGSTEATCGTEETLSPIQDNPVALVEEEERVQGAVRAIVYRIYGAFVGRRWLSFILISIILMQISKNGSDFWLSVWVDKTSTTANTDTALYLNVFLCLAMANSLFTAARAFSFAYGGLSAAFKVHESLLKRILAAPVNFFDHNPKGRILNRFSSDQYAVDDSLPFISNILLANFFSLLGIIIILCVVQWTFLVILIPLGYIYIGLQKYYRCTSRELRRLDSTSRSPIYSSFTEALDGSTTIRAFEAQDIFCSKNEGYVAVNQRTSYSEIVASLWLSIRLQLLAACIISFISIMSFWGRQVRSPVNSATAGLVGLALSYATPIISLLSDLLSTFTETEKEMVSVERINEYMEVESEQKERTELEAGPNWPSKGHIEFCNVSLFYGPMLPPALKNLSFVIQGGLQVGIAGRTGAGKSSILNVLFRLTAPTTGHITIDGIDMSKVSLHQLRSKLGIVPQTPFLFEGTVRDNVDLHGNATDLRIWEILDKCHLKETVLSLGGLDMHVKEGGESFSLGQRQLLCLARSFLQPTKVLCLDECTANVDPQTSWILQRAIASECKGMTIITIAHRMQSILNLDHVLILEHGELAEEGNPQALLCNPTSKLSSLVKASRQ
eukprot:c20437_g1_i1 orf=297-4817(-)